MRMDPANRSGSYGDHRVREACDPYYPASLLKFNGGGVLKQMPLRAFNSLMRSRVNFYVCCIRGRWV